MYIKRIEWEQFLEWLRDCCGYELEDLKPHQQTSAFQRWREEMEMGDDE